MYRNTVLKPIPCDVKKLPLGAVEAFILSQIDGRSTLEEIAQIAGLEFSDATEIAKRLAELGAVQADEKSTVRKWGAPAGSAKEPAPQKRMSKPPRPKSIGPQAKSVTPPPKSVAPKSLRSTSKTRPAVSESPPHTNAHQKTRSPSRTDRRAASSSAMRAARRHSSTSMNARSAPSSRTGKAAPEVCDLDEATRDRILDLDARIGSLDLYALLEIDRDADKKTVKRAYFAMASKLHPDRFFGKKLGHVRVPLERIFSRITLAHDTLSNKEKREEYDATLPPPPPKPSARPGKRNSMVPRKSSRKMKAVTQPPEPAHAPPAPKGPSRPPPRHHLFGPERPRAVAPEPPPPVSPRVVAEDQMRRLYASAKQNEAQRRVDLFLRAAEDAMKKDDLIGAANNYRLAVQNTDDPEVKKKLAAIDGLAKSRHFEQSLVRARGAEKQEKWFDAATYFLKAHASRPDDAFAADRAANALRHSGGDLHQAAELAEKAIAADPKNAGYHVTLGEIYLAAKLYTRASAQATRALAIAPSDPRAKAFAAALGKKK